MQLDAARRALDLPDMDYEATLGFKKAFARKVFDSFGQETLDSLDFQVRPWFLLGLPMGFQGRAVEKCLTPLGQETLDS
jgi:hypothetical protein